MGDIISFDQALALVANAATPLPTERVSLADANRRTLAEPVVAAVDWPPSDVSAMDGYAVRDGDPWPLTLVGESAPAAPFEAMVGTGKCVRIFTGATVPAPCDRVVPQELVERDGDRVALISPTSAARHIRLRGSDFIAGDVLIEAGNRLGPATLVTAAGADLAEVWVHRRPRVTILATGDELVAPGTARHTVASIPDSNSVGIAALVADHGGQVIAIARLCDDKAQMEAAARAAVATSDVVIMIGGASVGDRDYSKPVFAALGLDLLFAKVAIKPGKPVWFGRVGEVMVIGLPGNPASAMITARLLLVPLLIGLLGGKAGDALPWQSRVLAAPLAPLVPSGDRENFVLARWAGSAVAPLADAGSGSQRSLGYAQLLIRQSAGHPGLAAGESVDVIGL